MKDRYLPDMESFEMVYKTGKELKEEGMARVDAAADPKEMDAIDSALVELARSGKVFTAEDVRTRAGQISRPNLMGSRFHNARKMGLIVSCGIGKSHRRSRHSATIHLWRGKSPLSNGGINREDAMAARKRDNQLEATQKILDVTEGFSKKEKAAIFNFVLEKYGLGPVGQAIDAEEKAKAAEAKKEEPATP